MSANFKRAREGYHYEVTELGKQDPRIYSKYQDSYHSTNYKVSVPMRWITKGYVQEVKDEGEQT